MWQEMSRPSLLLYMWGQWIQQILRPSLALTLSGSRVPSTVSKSASASEYWSAMTSSSICSGQGRIEKHQMELPSIEAAVLSIGVVIIYNGDFADGEEIISHMFAFWFPLLRSGWLSGKGIVWEIWSERGSEQNCCRIEWRLNLCASGWRCVKRLGRYCTTGTRKLDIKK